MFSKVFTVPTVPSMKCVSIKRADHNARTSVLYDLYNLHRLLEMLLPFKILLVLLYNYTSSTYFAFVVYVLLCLPLWLLNIDIVQGLNLHMIRLGFLDGRLWLISIELFYHRSCPVKLTISHQYECSNLLTFNEEIIWEIDFKIFQPENLFMMSECSSLTAFSTYNVPAVWPRIKSRGPLLRQLRAWPGLILFLISKRILHMTIWLRF